MVIGLTLSLAFLLVGIFLRNLLVQAPAVILVLICVNLAIAAGIGLLVYSVNHDTTELVVMGVVFLISIYLLVNVNRLSREERERALGSDEDDLVDVEEDEEDEDEEVRKPPRRPRK
jgi:predicted RND superfamily exporter protein